ncbi:MAG: hypothetical protein IPL52_10655 [Flavobacteriales bacterium]|nr:hypothetical protein [Flavobacteriales bacterium]
MRTPGAACLPEARRLAEGALRLGAGQHAMAYSVIGSLADRDYSEAILDEAGRMQTYINVLKDAAEDGRNAYPLNSGELTKLMDTVDVVGKAPNARSPVPGGFSVRSG